ncbi:hypothetical protein [Halomonas binhaiensis]|uniref:Uncharacterized protein n=1 Tax=Halomonas binhaiensis TaxID=2562282 RepID=A0A5C1NFS4_9GAMM|nr:hypothetical protein [Halomonas binhaiensis]QEM80539.1 hypothetical protein E4T21_02430 [Halomonas binhaiensis]
MPVLAKMGKSSFLAWQKVSYHCFLYFIYFMVLIAVHNLYIPVIMIVVAIGLVIGAATLSDGDVDANIQHAIAATLDTSEEVVLKDMKEVNHGYGVCGWYQLAGSGDEAARFFYTKVDDEAELDVDSRRYRMNCKS